MQSSSGAAEVILDMQQNLVRGQEREEALKKVLIQIFCHPHSP